MTVNSIFARWARIIESDPNLWSRFPGRYLWEISGPDATVWLLDASPSREPMLRPSEGEGADFAVRIDQRHFLALARGELNPQIAFLQGYISVRGKTKYALRFNLLLEQLIRAVSPRGRGVGEEGEGMTSSYLT